MAAAYPPPSGPLHELIGDPASPTDIDRSLLREMELVNLSPLGPATCVSAAASEPQYDAEAEFARTRNLLAGLLARAAVDDFLKMWRGSLDKPERSLPHIMTQAGLDIILELFMKFNQDERAMWKNRRCSVVLKALLKGGVVDMCAGFLAHLRTPRPHSIKVMSAIVRSIADWCMREVQAGRGLGPLAPQMVHLYGEWWQALWRTHVHHHPPPTSADRLSKESESIDAMLDVVWTISHFVRLCQSIPVRTMGRDAFIAFRRVALLAWFMPANDVYIETGLRDSCLSFALNLWMNMQTESGFTEKDCDAFIEEDLLSVYGPDLFLSRLCEVIRKPWDGDDLGTYSKFPPVLMKVIKNPAFRTRYVSSGTLKAVRDVVDLLNERKPNVNTQWELHEAVLAFYMAAVDSGAAINQVIKPLFESYDIFEFLARSSLCYVKADDVEDDDELSLVEQSISTFALVAGGASVHSQKEELRNGMRESLRPHWYRVIWELGSVGAYDHRARTKCEKVIIAWTALGDTLGMRFEDEKAGFEEARKKARQMCALRECMYHTQEPPISTRACKGCGEVRYCSRECQVKDWKQGHKNECKRLKASG